MSENDDALREAERRLRSALDDDGDDAGTESEATGTGDGDGDGDGDGNGDAAEDGHDEDENEGTIERLRDAFGETTTDGENDADGDDDAGGDREGATGGSESEDESDRSLESEIRESLTDFREGIEDARSELAAFDDADATEAEDAHQVEDTHEAADANGTDERAPGGAREAPRNRARSSTASVGHASVGHAPIGHGGGPSNRADMSVGGRFTVGTVGGDRSRDARDDGTDEDG